MSLAPLAPSAPAVALPPSPARCLAYIAALRSAIRRDETTLAELRRLDGQPRPGGRGQGLEYAIAETEQTIAVLRELEGAVHALAPLLPGLHQLAGALAPAELAA